MRQNRDRGGGGGGAAVEAGLPPAAEDADVDVGRLITGLWFAEVAVMKRRRLSELMVKASEPAGAPVAGGPQRLLPPLSFAHLPARVGS